MKFAARLLAALLGLASLSAPAFDLQGHRGARGLAPENTLAAFALALSIGVDTLETDIAITRDGVLVISHDPALNPDITRGPDGPLGGAINVILPQARFSPGIGGTAAASYDSSSQGLRGTAVAPNAKDSILQDGTLA